MGTTIEGSNFESAITQAFTVRRPVFPSFDLRTACTVSGEGLDRLQCNSFVALQKLYRYISGNNADNAKISMTTPVITFVKPSEDFKSAEKNYTVAFYLPQQFQV